MYLNQEPIPKLMRSVFSLLILLVSGFLFPAMSHSQVVTSIENPMGNTAVRIEKMEWTKPASGTPIAASFMVRNNTKDRVIHSIQFTLVAMDKNNVILQDGGATLRRLYGNTNIPSGEAGMIYFDKAFTIGQINSIELKQAIVQFTDGALEILKK